MVVHGTAERCLEGAPWPALQWAGSLVDTAPAPGHGSSSKYQALYRAGDGHIGAPDLPQETWQKGYIQEQSKGYAEKGVL